MTQQLMGADEVRSLVGKWQSIVGDARVIDRGHVNRGGYGAREGRGGFGAGEQREERGFGRYGGWQGQGQGQGQGQESPREERHEKREMRKEEWERLHPGQDWWERERRRQEWERTRPGIPFVGVEALVGAWYAVVGKDADSMATQLGVPPRNLLVDQPPPQFARREALPLNSGTVTVGFNGTLQITSRPQRPAYRPERFFVAPPVGGSLAENASAWIINDITIGNKSQFAQSGQLPGDMFSSTSIDSFVSFDTVQTAMDVVIIATYVGQSNVEQPVSFIGGMLGTSAVHC